jgi:spermidine synthase
VHREYWWRALTEVRVPRRPSVLLVGLGGGTQVHLLRQIARPRALAVVERDAVIMHAAEDWFDLVRVGGLEYLCGEAADVVRSLAAVGRRFDLVIEDAAYADDPERAVPLALALAPLVTARGALVVNRHRRSDAAGLARRLRRRFREVRQVRVRREGENVLVCCARPRLRM